MKASLRYLIAIVLGVVLSAEALHAQACNSILPIVSPTTVNCGDPISMNTAGATYQTTAGTCLPTTGTSILSGSHGASSSNLNCDDCYIEGFTLPFTFNFFGTNYSEIDITSNGFITFGDGFEFSGYSPSSIPNVANPNNFIAGVYGDLDPRGSCGCSPAPDINYAIGGVSPNQYLVINYVNIPGYSCNCAKGLTTFQFILNENGSFNINIIDKPSTLLHDTFSGTEWLWGAESADGNFTVTLPGRNWETWSATNDCRLISPACTFVNWTLNGVEVATTTSATINATASGSLSANYLCGGSPCSNTVAIAANCNPQFDAPSTICTSETNATILDLDNYKNDPGTSGTWSCPTCPGGLFNTATGVLTPSVITNPPQLYAITYSVGATNSWIEYIAIVSCSQSCGVELAGVENPLCNTDGAYTVYDPRVLDGVTLTAPGAGSSANVFGTYDVFADTSSPLTADLTAIGGSGFVDNGNGTLTINPALITYANSGFYTIRYTIDDTAAPFDNCDGAVYFEVFELYPTYNPAFTLQTNACTTDGNITLALTTTPSPVPAGVTADDIEDWYGDGVTDAAGTGGTFSPSTAGAGVHTVCVDVGATTCIATYCQTITVYGAPSASATNTGPYCTGDPIQLNASGGASFSWNGPSGYTSSLQNPSNATLAGVYTVTVTQGNSCTSTASTTVIIYPTLDPTFAIPQAICENSSAWNAATVISTLNPISLTTAITVPGNLAALGFTAANITDWYGDGVTDNGATASFTPLLTSGSAQTGTYTICVDVGYSLGCTQTHCQTILVTPQPNPTIVSRTVCVGSLPATVDLTVMFSNVLNNPTTPGGSWNLTGGSGTGSTNGDILTLTAAGTFNFTYLVTTEDNISNTCDASDVGTLTVQVQNPLFDAPSSFCLQDGSVNMTTFLPATSTAGGTWSMNTGAGFNNAVITTLGVFDPLVAFNANPLSNYVTIRYTVGAGAGCTYTHDEIVLITSDCDCPEISSLQLNALDLCSGTNVTTTTITDEALLGQSISFCLCTRFFSWD